MNGSVLKDTLREIKKTFGRFISIMGIVLVGVAFFVGVKASAPYMKKSADSFFDRSNFFDLKLYSTIGFSKEDVDAVKDTAGISGVQGGYDLDVLTDVDEREYVLQVMSYDIEASDPINQIKVVEGRLPKKSGECVIRDYKMKNLKLNIGDTIKIYSGSNQDIKDSLITDEYTIVGFVNTPYYLSYQYESAAVGSGKVSSLMYVPQSDFITERFTVMYATVDGAAQKDCYKDEYFDVVNPVKDEVKITADKQTKSAYDAMCQLAELKFGTSAGVVKPEWYVLDRKSHFSYVDYGNCGDRMDAIAKVFPVFFYLVAALVCLTTMTRMVDEQREHIGTMKALGYGKFAIASKYVIYALFASVTGGILGCILGLKTFPAIIFNAWNIVYTVDEMTKVSQFSLCVVAVLVAVAVTTVTTIIACISELVAAPALLLRPKAPKNGKKILLEHISFIWNRFSFSQKVTARNIFRYKKRFFMTVIGISGCTALILAGFGIKNSVSKVATGQYGDIFMYDMEGSLNPDTDLDSFYEYCQNDDRIETAMCVHSNMINAYSDNNPDSKEKTATLISVEDAAEYSNFTSLTDKKSGKKINITDDGAIITYKLAKNFNLKTGDTIYVKDADEKFIGIKINDITNMYVGQYIFINDRYYEELFDRNIKKNTFIAVLSEKGLKDEQNLGTKLMNEFDLTSITYFDEMKSNFETLIKSLDIIVVVLIISAALLAFVVLYNLINVNVSERIREIATIKVLGFFDGEVAAYVYRENIILSIIGAAFGLILGIFLHGYIIDVIEMDDVIFPKSIFGYSYIVSFLITVVFGILVNLFMNGRLKRIPMVESLKSIE